MPLSRTVSITRERVPLAGNILDHAAIQTLPGDSTRARCAAGSGTNPGRGRLLANGSGTVPRIVPRMGDRKRIAGTGKCIGASVARVGYSHCYSAIHRSQFVILQGTCLAPSRRMPTPTMAERINPRLTRRTR